MIGLFSLESCWNAQIPSTTAIKTEKEKERERERERGRANSSCSGQRAYKDISVSNIVAAKVTKEADYVQRLQYWNSLCGTSCIHYTPTGNGEAFAAIVEFRHR